MGKLNQLLVLVFLAIIMAVAQAKYLEIKRMKVANSKIVSRDSSQCTPVGSNNQSVLGFGNCQDTIYYINIQVGTPSQTLGVQFDTGSNILWIPTTKVISTGFNTAASSTYVASTTPDSITYADGSSVSGVYGTDILKIANTPISVKSSILMVSKQVQMNYPSQIQGLVGMGYTKTPNFLDLAYSNGQISSPVFALALTDPLQQSVIYYNEIPEQIANATSFVPVTGSTYWQVHVIGMTVGDMDLTEVSANIAIIDSGTSLFYLNSNLFNSIISNFFSSCNNNLNTPICPCKANYPTFAFMFEGIEVYIDQNSYMLQVTASQCTYLFGVLSTVPNILLGDIFFRNYVITFDKLNQQIGFYGNINFLQNVELKGGDAIGYVMLGIVGLLFFMAVASYCVLGSFLSQRPTPIAYKSKGLPSYSPGLKVKLNQQN